MNTEEKALRYDQLIEHARALTHMSPVDTQEAVELRLYLALGKYHHMRHALEVLRSEADPVVKSLAAVAGALVVLEGVESLPNIAYMGNYFEAWKDMISVMNEQHPGWNANQSRSSVENMLYAIRDVEVLKTEMLQVSKVAEEQIKDAQAALEFKAVYTKLLVKYFGAKTEKITVDSMSMRIGMTHGMLSYCRTVIDMLIQELLNASEMCVVEGAHENIVQLGEKLRAEFKSKLDQIISLES